MKKTLFALTACCLLVVLTACQSATNFSVGKANAGAHARAHNWEMPHFNLDLQSNPVNSEVGLGFVTLGSQAGWTAEPEGKWATFSTGIGPDTKPVPEDGN